MTPSLLPKSCIVPYILRRLPNFIGKRMDRFHPQLSRIHADYPWIVVINAQMRL